MALNMLVVFTCIVVAVYYPAVSTVLRCGHRVAPTPGAAAAGR